MNDQNDQLIKVCAWCTGDAAAVNRRDHQLAASGLHTTPMRCRVCGCTDDDCSGCIARTGEPCHWIKPGLCSACGR